MADYEKKSAEAEIVFHNPNTKEKFEKYIKKILIDKLLAEYKKNQ